MLEKKLSKTAELSRMHIAYAAHAQALTRLAGYPQLDAWESRMLEALGAAWSANRETSMQDAADLVSLEISTTTAQRYLHSLAEKGMIALEVDSRDARFKRVTPTHATHRYFALLWRCIVNASSE
jgi:hypothetical protein